MTAYQGIPCIRGPNNQYLYIYICVYMGKGATFLMVKATTKCRSGTNYRLIRQTPESILRGLENSCIVEGMGEGGFRLGEANEIQTSVPTLARRRLLARACATRSL